MKSFLFKEHLLKQTVKGKKTQTRRTHGLEKINADPDRYLIKGIYPSFLGPHQNAVFFDTASKDVIILISCKPKYNIGDIVYLKENYCFDEDGSIIYQCDVPVEKRKNFTWKSKLMMPEAYARYFVEITGIRCERLTDISEVDAIAEGVETVMGGILYGKRYKDYENKMQQGFPMPVTSFFSLFSSINGREVINHNPYVFVYEFKNYKNKKKRNPLRKNL